MTGGGGDVYGATLQAVLAGRRVSEIVERDDGFVRSYPSEYLVEPFRRWRPIERRALRFVRGRVLDLGCGGGRVCLHLQERGFDVTGIDSSEGAVGACRQRGVRDARVLPIERVDASLGRFDTFLLLGQNFGLLGTPASAQRLLRRFHRLTSERGRIVAQSYDPHASADPADVAYRARNRRSGRMAGELRVRVRHRELATSWFEYLQVSPAELEELAESSGWRVARTLADSPAFVAVLDKGSLPPARPRPRPRARRTRGGPTIGDGYGALLLDSVAGPPRGEIVERDDGFIETGEGALAYFAPFRRWPAHQRTAMRHVRGRVLDVGCGAGRVALHLQQRGHEVVAVDISPGAVEVCRRRGVHDVRVLPIEDVDESLGTFDTIVMFGNNLGLLAGRAKGRRLLRRLHRLTSERGRIVAETRDVHATTDPAHLGYHERNRRRGRMDGQIRIRVRHRELATPWFDYLMVSPDELRGLLAGTGWRLARTIGPDDLYVAVIEKEAPAVSRASA